jgi:hypothetical protein
METHFRIKDLNQGPDVNGHLEPMVSPQYLAFGLVVLTAELIDNLTYLLLDLSEVCSPLERVFQWSMHIFVILSVCASGDTFGKYIIPDMLMGVIFGKRPFLVLLPGSLCR